MAETLYNMHILRLAAAIPHDGRLDNPQASSARRSPVCGSRVTVDVNVDGQGRISALGQEVRACALGQASAALMGAHAIGRSAQELAVARDALAAFLNGEKDSPGDWPGLEIFGPARAHKARHASIMLAFQVVAEACAIAAGNAEKKDG
jgi:NifU-like protein involved in Fe-S cluster formation